jgi:hypothetical protein
VPVGRLGIVGRSLDDPETQALIRQGAADGSFDRDLAGDSAVAEEFFAKLKRALVTGYFVEDVGTGKLATVAVPGYVFWPDDRHSGMPPVGFGLFRSIEDTAYELWLAGLDLTARSGGQGRALLAALFGTPPGQKTYIVRVHRDSNHIKDLQSLLVDFGFTAIGDTAQLRWFLHHDAPEALASRVRQTVDSRAALN